MCILNYLDFTDDASIDFSQNLSLQIIFKSVFKINIVMPQTKQTIFPRKLTYTTGINEAVNELLENQVSTSTELP